MTVIHDLRELIPLLETDRPQGILLDAMGTLFSLKHSVGDIYGAIAVEYGVMVDPDTITAAFFQQFASAPPLAFGETDDVAAQEYHWWYGLVKTVFEQLEGGDHFTDFDAYFQDLYTYFAGPDPWIIYDDVEPLLTACQSAAIPLGVLSNFDSRLDKILHHLALKPYFQTVILSSHCQDAKPSATIFTQAIQTMGTLPSQTWHIGDSLREDYQGSTAAGLRGILIDRVIEARP